MAMRKCKECGGQVSTKAKTCPSCGAKAPAKTSLVTWLVLVLIVAAIYGVGTTPEPTATASQANASAAGTSSIVENSQQEAQIAPSPPSWSVFTSTDEMTGKLQAFAHSPESKPTKQMNFPYHNVQGWLGFGCDGESEWAYFGFSEAPNLNDTETEDGYNSINARVKWNEQIEKTALTQSWGAKFLHFSNNPAAIANISRSSSTLLELNWHGQQSVYFPFTLNGSTKAIQEARSKCKSK